MGSEVISGARVGSRLRYGFEFVIKGRLCGVQIEFDEKTADDLVRAHDPSLAGPRGEWFLDDDTICDRLDVILSSWVGTMPLSSDEFAPEPSLGDMLRRAEALGWRATIARTTTGSEWSAWADDRDYCKCLLFDADTPESAMSGLLALIEGDDNGTNG